MSCGNKQDDKYQYVDKQQSDKEDVKNSLEKANRYLLVQEADAAALKIFSGDKGLAINYLTEFSNNQGEESTLSRKKMGEYLMVKYLDGVLKVEKDKKFTKNDKNIPPTVVRPGYTESYNRNIVNENKERFRYKSQEELKNRK